MVVRRRPCPGRGARSPPRVAAGRAAAGPAAAGTPRTSAGVGLVRLSPGSGWRRRGGPPRLPSPMLTGPRAGLPPRGSRTRPGANQALRDPPALVGPLLKEVELNRGRTHFGPRFPEKPNDGIGHTVATRAPFRVAPHSFARLVAEFYEALVECESGAHDSLVVEQLDASESHIEGFREEVDFIREGWLVGRIGSRKPSDGNCDRPRCSRKRRQSLRRSALALLPAVGDVLEADDENGHHRRYSSAD